jgi:hypothetical protein
LGKVNPTPGFHWQHIGLCRKAENINRTGPRMADIIARCAVRGLLMTDKNQHVRIVARLGLYRFWCRPETLDGSTRKN